MATPNLQITCSNILIVFSRIEMHCLYIVVLDSPVLLVIKE